MCEVSKGFGHDYFLLKNLATPTRAHRAPSFKSAQHF